MEHVITTYGGGELFTLIFNGIAALFKADKTGMITPLIHIGLLVGSVYMMILMFFKSSLAEGAKWLLWVVLATNLLFLPKTTIWIHDPLTKVKTKVDHVPFALGYFASLVSQVGRTVTEKVESVFTLPNYMPYHKTGTVFASSLMSQVGQFRIVDPVFKGNMERFVNQCVVYDAMIGQKYTLQDLQNTSNIWELVKSKASPVLGFLYKDGNTPGDINTCRLGAHKLHELWTTEITKATAFYGARVQNQTLAKKAFFINLQDGYQLMTGIAENASNILRQALMINAIEESSNNKLSELGVPSNYAATKALLQQRSAYAAAGAIAAKTLPLFKNVVEALSYGLFIFIVVLALMPNGYRVVITYFGILVWTQLWAPLYAILNLIMTLYGKAETLSHGAESGLTLLNSSAIINANADMATLAAWLSVSIPFISYGILKQGAAAFVGLAQHLGSAMQSAASGAAAETVSGNISLGNVSMGTQTYQNTTAFQHNTSPTYNASQFKSMGASGIEKSTFADGTQTFNDQAMSHLSVQIIGTENTNFAKQESLNNATNSVKSKSTAATQATESSLQNSTNFLSHVSKAIGTGTDLTKTIGASQAQTLQDFNSYVEDIRKSNNYTRTQALEAAIGAKVGIDFMGMGASASGSFADTQAFQDAIEGATSLAKQKNYSDSMEKIISAAQSYSEKHDEGRLAELGTDATASLNQASSLREEASVAQNEMDTISKDLSSGHSKSFSVSKVLDQEVLTFIANQPANAGPTGASGGKMGYDRARHIFEKGGAERDAYLDQFQKENPQYAIQEIRYGQEKAALTQQYDTQASQIRNQANVDKQNSQNTQEVLKQGKNMGLTPNNTSIPSVERPKPEMQGTQTKQESSGVQQNPSTERPAQGAGNSQPTTTLQTESSQKSQIFNGGVNSQIGLAPQSQAQNTPEVLKQGNGMGLSPNNVSPPSVEREEQRRQSEQENSSMENFVRSGENSQSAAALIGSQGESAQSYQTFKQRVNPQADLAQNHIQNTQEVLKKGNDMSLASNNESPTSVERVEQGRQSEQQNPSMENAVRSGENSQSAAALIGSQGGSSQNSQTSNQEVNPQANLAQNHIQNTQEVLNQNSDMGPTINNTSIPSAGRPGQGRQGEQQNSSTDNPLRGGENFQPAIGSQEAPAQSYQSFKQGVNHQANLAQNHIQNTQEVLKQGKDMRLTPNNTPIPSVERPKQETQRAQQNPSTEKLTQSSENSQSTTASLDENPQTFKAEVNEFFKNIDSQINQGQRDLAQHKEKLQGTKKKPEKVAPKVSSIRTDLHSE